MDKYKRQVEYAKVEKYVLKNVVICNKMYSIDTSSTVGIELIQRAHAVLSFLRIMVSHPIRYTKTSKPTVSWWNQYVI